MLVPYGAGLLFQLEVLQAACPQGRRELGGFHFRRLGSFQSQFVQFLMFGRVSCLKLTEFGRPFGLSLYWKRCTNCLRTRDPRRSFGASSVPMLAS